jgi:hypothetical protein
VRIRRTLVPLVVVVATALTACGGGDDSSADEPQPTSTASDSPSDTAADACALLTTDAVAQAVGSPVKEGVATSGTAVTGGSFSTCVWQSDDPDQPADTATIMIYPNAAAADSAREDDSQDVPGIGDKAFSGSFASIWVYVGDQSLFAQWYAFSGSDGDSLPKSEALAKAAADAL